MRFLLVSLLGGLLLAAPQLRPVRRHVLSPAASYGAGGVAPWFVQAADLNGDGHLDLIATSDGSGQPIVLHVFLGDGAGGFMAGQVERTTFATARNLEVADVNGDGRSDVLIATNDNAGHILIWAGRGDGTLATPTALPPIVDPPLLNDGTQRLICVDLDGDGRVDLAVAHFATPFDVISVRLGRGDGTFGNARIWPTPSPVDLAAGDLNGDGWPDLAVASYGSQTVTCFLNLGGGELRQSSVLPVGDVPFSLALADLNGDGWTDAAVAGNSGHSVAVLLNRIPEHRRPPAER